MDGTGPGRYFAVADGPLDGDITGPRPKLQRPGLRELDVAGPDLERALTEKALAADLLRPARADHPESPTPASPRRRDPEGSPILMSTDPPSFQTTYFRQFLGDFTVKFPSL